MREIVLLFSTLIDCHLISIDHIFYIHVKNLGSKAKRLDVYEIPSTRISAISHPLSLSLRRFHPRIIEDVVEESIISIHSSFFTTNC